MTRLTASLCALMALVCACSGGRVDYPDPGIDNDSGTCGVLGGSCCANDSCGSGLSCESGTCQQARMGELGKPCARNGDCQSGICFPLPGAGRNVCTTSCATTTCVAGWSCAPLGGTAGNVCQCSPSTETCDGLDNDCDGIVDNEPAVDGLCVQQLGAGYACLASACQLPQCNTTDDCLGGQICDPLSRHCVVPTDTDAGFIDRDAGHPDAGHPDGGHPDAGSPDAGSQPCATRYDCGFGQACLNGHCSTVADGNSCTANSQCGRGQTCSFSHQCTAGCLEQRDCQGTLLCNGNTGLCESCGRDNQCPTGQICKDIGAGLACQSTTTCSSSTTCNNTVAGSVCTGGACRNCAQDSDCNVSPYDSSYTCGSNGLCAVQTVSCDIAQCSTTCYAQGLICDTTGCGCMGPAHCNNAACPSGPCGAGTSCDPNMCTCTQNAACAGSTYCAGFSGIPLFCSLQSGTCDASCNCSAITTCGSSSPCGAHQVCADSSCQDIAVDSLGRACTLAQCRASNHPCKNANTGAGCICSNANSDGFSGTTSPVACD